MVRVLKSYRQQERLRCVSVRQKIYRPVRSPDAIVVFQRYIPIIRFSAETGFCKACRFGITREHLLGNLRLYPLAVMASDTVSSVAESKFHRLEAVVGPAEFGIAIHITARFHRLRGGRAERLKMRLADIVRAIPHLGEPMRNHRFIFWDVHADIPCTVPTHEPS